MQMVVTGVLGQSMQMVVTGILGQSRLAAQLPYECPRGCYPRDSRGRSHILLLPGFHSLAHTLTCPVCTPHVHTHTQGSRGRVRSTMGPGGSCSPSTRDLPAARPPPHQVDGRAVSWEAHLFRHKCSGFRPFYPHADCGTEGASPARAGGLGSMRRGGHGSPG